MPPVTRPPARSPTCGSSTCPGCWPGPGRARCWAAWVRMSLRADIRTKAMTPGAGGGPVKAGVALTDVLTGLHAVAGILAALAWRERSGLGQHIDLALLDVQVSCLANQALNYLATGQAPARLGNAHPSIVPYEA